MITTFLHHEGVKHDSRAKTGTPALRRLEVVHGIYWKHIHKFFVLCVAAALVPLFYYVRTAEAQSYQGFGATTPGGSGGTVVHVTNLNDSGPGSLRDAVKGGNRTVVFDVGGEINLTSAISVTGAFMTIDGFTASSPGITLKGAGLSLHGTKGAHDVIIRGIRIRASNATPSHDGITIAYGAYNIVVDHVSISGSIDENIDITEGSHDVTVSWSILGGNGKNMLIKYQPSRVTLHHNLFIESVTRTPRFGSTPRAPPPPTRPSTCATTSSGTGVKDTGHSCGMDHGPTS